MQVSSATVDSAEAPISVTARAPAPPQLSGQQHQTCQGGAGTDPDEALARADAILCEEQWTWVRELLETVGDRKKRNAAKCVFLRLLEAATSDAIDVVLTDLDTWRSSVDAGGKSSRTKSLREVARTLFMLGADKQLDLMQKA